MIILVTGYFDRWDEYSVRLPGKELLVSHGVDDRTDEIVVMPHVHPTELGAYFDPDVDEWIIDDE